MSEPTLLDVAGVTVRRGPREAVRDVTLRVAPGERVALVGPNAAGKSTLLGAVAGLFDVAAGAIAIEGRPISRLDSREVARRVALVVALQEGAPRISVRESAELGRYPHTGPFRGPGAADQEAVEHAIRQTGLEALADRALGSLSAGERQRALIARALAQEPKLLLLDEPSAHLDIGHSLDLFALLTRIAARNVAIVAVVHDLVSAARWASRMVVLHEGRIIDDGPPTAVMTGDALGRAFGVRIEEAVPRGNRGGTTWRFDRP